MHHQATKSLRCLLLIMVAWGGVFVGQVAAQSEHWSKVEVLDGKVVIEMPKEREYEKTEKEEFPVGTITTHLYDAREGMTRMSFSYTDVPGIGVFFSGRDGIYKQGREGLIGDAKGTEVSRRKIKQNGVEGLEVIYEVPQMLDEPALRGIARFFLLDKTLVVLNARHDFGSRDKTAIAFLDSLKLSPSSGVEAASTDEVPTAPAAPPAGGN